MFVFKIGRLSCVLLVVLLFGRFVYVEVIIVGNDLLVGVFMLVLMIFVSGCYRLRKCVNRCILVFVFSVV